MAGRYFDEWEVGDRVSHAITEATAEILLPFRT
jgi:hypothetical protein